MLRPISWSRHTIGLTLLLSSFLGVRAAFVFAGDQPNIVFCMADDWSWPHASILGDPVVKTPHFDRVANEGVLFENAFVSTPSCTPSRLSILAGQHHWRLREGDSLGGSLRESYPVYTELLQKAGYRIGRFGKGVWLSKHTFRKRDSFGDSLGSQNESGSFGVGLHKPMRSGTDISRSCRH